MEKLPVSRIKPEQKREIPASWFTETGAGDTAEMAFSEEFKKLGGPDFSKLVDHYIQIVYKNHLGYGTRVVRDYSKAVRMENERGVAEEAEKKIKEVTGFPATEIFESMLRILSDKRKKLQPSRVAQERKKEIPLSWFTAVGDKDEAVITVIIFSKEFENLGDAEFQDAVVKYGHYMGNTYLNGKPVRNSSEILDRERRAIVEAAEKKIKEVTGFSAKDLWEKRSKLNSAYHGKPKVNRINTVWGSRNSKAGR